MQNQSTHNNVIIAIGASTGGTEAVYSILKKLPATIPPVLIVQHMPPVFTQLYAQHLNENCQMQVKEAQNGDVLKPGLAFVAPGGYQMYLRKKDSVLSVECNDSDKTKLHCPSVDILFESVAEIMKANAIGIILTGMGSDGACGLLKMRNNGAKTIGQNAESCVIYGMPKVAYEIGAVENQQPLDKIPELIQQMCLFLYQNNK